MNSLIRGIYRFGEFINSIKIKDNHNEGVKSKKNGAKNF